MLFGTLSGNLCAKISFLFKMLRFDGFCLNTPGQIRKFSSLFTTTKREIIIVSNANCSRARDLQLVVVFLDISHSAQQLARGLNITCMLEICQELAVRFVCCIQALRHRIFQGYLERIQNIFHNMYSTKKYLFFV